MLQQRQLQQGRKLRISWVVMISTRIAISTAPKVMGSVLSTPCTVDVTSHKEMFSEAKRGVDF